MATLTPTAWVVGGAIGAVVGGVLGKRRGHQGAGIAIGATVGALSGGIALAGAALGWLVGDRLYHEPVIGAVVGGAGVYVAETALLNASTTTIQPTTNG